MIAATNRALETMVRDGRSARTCSTASTSSPSRAAAARAQGRHSAAGRPLPAAVAARMEKAAPVLAPLGRSAPCRGTTGRGTCGNWKTCWSAPSPWTFRLQCSSRRRSRREHRRQSRPVQPASRKASVSMVPCGGGGATPQASTGAVRGDRAAGGAPAWCERPGTALSHFKTSGNRRVVTSIVGVRQYLSPCDCASDC